MAKFENILNAPKHREEILKEHPEIRELEEFLKHLWSIIQVTEHSEEHQNPKITEQKRYEDALKSLFGENYSTIRKAPEGFSYADMRTIMLQKNKTGNLEGAIKDFLKFYQAPIETNDIYEKDRLECERDDKFDKDFKKIKQHLHQAEHIYEGPDFEEGRGFPWS